MPPASQASWIELDRAGSSCSASLYSLVAFACCIGCVASVRLLFTCMRASMHVRFYVCMYAYVHVRVYACSTLAEVGVHANT